MFSRLRKFSDGRNNVYRREPCPWGSLEQKCCIFLLPFQTTQSKDILQKHLQAPCFTDVLLYPVKPLPCFLKQEEKKISLCIPRWLLHFIFFLLNIYPLKDRLCPLTDLFSMTALKQSLCLLPVFSCTWALVTDSVFNNWFSGQWDIWNGGRWNTYASSFEMQHEEFCQVCIAGWQCFSAFADPVLQKPMYFMCCFGWTCSDFPAVSMFWGQLLQQRNFSFPGRGRVQRTESGI